MENLQLTKLVRKTIREHRKGYPSFYTNNYPNCRTVKTYSADKDGKLRAAVDAALREAGSTNHTIKVLAPTLSWHYHSSFIVRLPK